MSASLGLTLPNHFVFPSSPTGKSVLFSFVSSKPEPIQGHAIKEIKVSTTLNKDLPIRIVSQKSTEELKPVKVFRSTLTSPLISPRSLASSKARGFSPKYSKLLSEPTIEKISSPSRFIRNTTPKNDITEIIKNSLKLQQKNLKENMKKLENEKKSKIRKKMKLKLFDKFIRKENFSKFKQKELTPRPE